MGRTKYIDLMLDVSFKRIFGTEPNKDLLIDLLNGIFRGRKQIVDLVYNKNEHIGDIEEIGAVIFDLTCTAKDGERFIIEVQRSAQANLKRRMLYYGSKLISDQAPKGKRKEWDYAISEVYVIVLMDGFAMPEGEGDKGYLHDICLCSRDTGKVFYEDLGYIYIELRNFVKTESELETDLDGWLYVLKNMSRMDRLPFYLRKPVFEKLFDIAEYSKLTKEEMRMYDASLKRKWDEKAVMDYAKDYAKQEGIRQERERAEKEIEMLKDKAEAEKLQSVEKMLAKGLSIADAAEISGLSIEEVTAIQARQHGG